MRICSQYVGLRKVYEMTEFQSFKVSKFQRVAPNSISGLVFYIISFFFILIFGLEIPDVILAQETSGDAALEDVLSGFDDEGSDEDEALSGFDEGSPELCFCIGVLYNSLFFCFDLCPRNFGYDIGTGDFRRRWIGRCVVRI